MTTMTKYLVTFLILLFTTALQAQDTQDKVDREIELLQEQKEAVLKQEKEALKAEIEALEERYTQGEINEEELRRMKEDAARKRALNIEDRQRIIENKIALLRRNEGEVLSDEDLVEEWDDDGFKIIVNDRPLFQWRERHKMLKYDRRTYSDLVLAVGFNNALIDGESLDNSPYKLGGSRFLELGWVWRTRVFQNSNFLRFNYGFSFQFNGLKADDNMYFVDNNGQTELQEFEYDLKKAKLRMDNLVIPIHFEFGPSRFYESEKKIRYSLRNQFRLGLGGYGGINLGTRQKLKYTQDGTTVKDKLKRGYNTSNLIYGLSGYIGIDGVLLYAKYDLNPIFQDAEIEQHNLSVGVRFDM